MKRLTVLAILPMTFAAATGFAPSVARAADQALVVGINKYPNLNGANLDGSVNDATSIAGALKKYGFTVTLITDAKATRQGILTALAVEKKTVTPKDRFVFYYAGHGTKVANGGAHILPSDASQSTDKNDISADELYKDIDGVNAKSRTALMDSCFSGGMTRALSNLTGKKKFRTRYYNRAKSRGKDLVEVNNTDTTDFLAPGTGRVCYVTATTKSERAAEYEMDDGPEKGKDHGVFTVALLSALDGSKDKWGNVVTNVKGKVVEMTDDLQHPLLTGPYSDVTMFESKDAPVPDNDPTPKPTPAPTPNTLFDLYNKTNADAGKIQLTMEPKLSPVPIGTKFKFNVKVGAAGYLVIMERGTSGRINLLYPKSRHVDDSEVSEGQTIYIPTINAQTGKQMAYIADQAGTERVKAFLFSTPEEAGDVLKQFASQDPLKAGVSLTFLMAKSRDLVEVSLDEDKPEKTFYTTEAMFEVIQT